MKLKGFSFSIDNIKVIAKVAILIEGKKLKRAIN